MPTKKELTPQDRFKKLLYYHPEIGCMGRLVLVALLV